MPRRPRPNWNSRRQCYLASLGPEYIEPSTGRKRRRAVPLTHEDGRLIEWGDEAAAYAAIGRLIADAEAEVERRHSPTLAELWQAWVDWHRVVGSSHRTISGYVGAARAVLPIVVHGKALGETRASDLTVEHLFAVRAALRKAEYADGTVFNREGDLLACVRWGAQAIEGRVPAVVLRHNPYPKGFVRRSRREPSARKVPKDLATLAAILDATDRHAEGTRGRLQREKALLYATQVRLLGERGCRPAEVVRLRVDEAEWEGEGESRRLIGFTLGKHKTTHRGVRGVIPVSPGLAGRIKAIIEDPNRIGPWVFVPWRAESKGPPDDHRLSAWWGRNRVKIDGAVDFELYSFRNVVSNTLRLRGVGGRRLQLAIRHTSDVADTVYRRDTLDDAAEVFREAGL